MPTSRQGQGQVEARLRQGQDNVKARSRQGQGKVKGRSRQGQGKVRTRSKLILVATETKINLRMEFDCGVGPTCFNI